MNEAIPSVILADGTNGTRVGRFDGLSGTQMLAVHEEMVRRHAAEDSERRARHATILASFDR